MGMESTLKSSVLITIFVICIVTFAVQFAIDNDSDISIAGDSRFTGLNSSLRSNITSDLKDDAEDVQGIILLTNMVGDDTDISGTGAHAKIGPFTAMAMTVSSLTAGFNAIFGPEFGFILIAFVSLMSFLLVYYIAKAILGRDPN